MSRSELNDMYRDLAAELGDTIYKISILEEHVGKLKQTISEINSVASKLKRSEQPPPNVTPIRPPPTKPDDGKKN